MGLNNQNMKDYITKTKFNDGTTNKSTFRSKLRTPEMKLFAACRYANYHLGNHNSKDHIAINKSDKSALDNVKPNPNDNDTKLLKDLINAFNEGDWNKVVTAYSSLEVGKTKPKKLAFAILISSYLASKTKRQTRKKIFGNLRLRTPKKTEPNDPAKSADSDSVKSQSTTGNHQQKNNAEQPKSQSKRKFSQAKEDKNLQRVRIKHSKSTQELINWLLDPNNNTLNNDTKTNYQEALLNKLNDKNKKEKRIQMIKDAVQNRDEINIESIFGEEITNIILPKDINEAKSLADEIPNLYTKDEKMLLVNRKILNLYIEKTDEKTKRQILKHIRYKSDYDSKISTFYGEYIINLISEHNILTKTEQAELKKDIKKEAPKVDNLIKEIINVLFDKYYNEQKEFGNTIDKILERKQDKLYKELLKSNFKNLRNTLYRIDTELGTINLESYERNDLFGKKIGDLYNINEPEFEKLKQEYSPASSE